MEIHKIDDCIVISKSRIQEKINKLKFSSTTESFVYEDILKKSTPLKPIVEDFAAMDFVNYNSIVKYVEQTEIQIP